MKTANKGAVRLTKSSEFPRTSVWLCLTEESGDLRPECEAHRRLTKAQLQQLAEKLLEVAHELEYT